MLITLVFAEILLRMYDPFHASVSGNHIKLLSNLTRQINNNDVVDKLDKTITVRTNKLGFRGPDLPQDANQCLKILTIGGSTTECLFINDGKTWSDLLSQHLQENFNHVWLNNAGLDGHSTFGHLTLLKEYVVKLKPDVCIFLIGCNDVGRNDLNDFDAKINTGETGWAKLAKYSSVASLCMNLYRHHLAAKMDLPHNKHFTLLGNQPLTLPGKEVDSLLVKDSTCIQQFGKRIQEIISTCRAAGIQPVLLTQPSLLGEGRDSVTGVDLSTFRLNDKMSGTLYWRRLDSYNDETRKIAKDSNVYLIDLAKLLPKSYAYYYDIIHYDNNGCKKVGEIVSDQMTSYLKSKGYK